MSLDDELIEAVEAGHAKKVEELLEKGANPNIKTSIRWYHGWTPLHIAVYERNLDIVRLLIKYGANINAKTYNRETPLHIAVYEGHWDVAKLLIDHGADVNARNNNGSTPLHIAAERGFLDIVQLLLEKGADPNILDSKARTPANLAAKKGYENVVALLKEYMEGKRKPKNIELIEVTQSTLMVGNWGSISLKFKGKGIFSLDLEGDADFLVEDSYSLAGERVVEVAVRPGASGRLPVKVTVKSGETKATKLIWLNVEENKSKCPECGAPVELGALYCWKCGAKLR